MPKKKKVDAGEDLIPPAIKKQADKALDLQKELNKPAEDPNDPNDPNEPAQVVEPAADPVEPDPAAPAEPAVSYVPPAIADPQSADDSSYRNKYDILKGKYDSEVPALRREIDSLKTVMNQMQTTIETQSQVAASSSPARVETGIKPLDPDNFSEYGDEIIMLAKGFNSLLEHNEQLAAKIAHGSSQPSELIERTERLEATVQKTNEDRYYEDLDREVPDWRVINKLGAFDQWLREIDPISMAARMDILQFAATNLNALQVSNIFKQYKMDSGMVEKPAKAPAPAPTVVNPHLSGQIMPEANLAPENEMQPTGQQVVYPTATEFKQASSDMVQGRITEAQYNDIANRYQMAIKAGKVRP